MSTVTAFLIGPMITGLQVRMARAALGWGVRDLAKKSGVSPNTISRFENGSGAMANTLLLIQQTFEGAGIVFIAADDRGGSGVRFKK